MRRSLHLPEEAANLTVWHLKNPIQVALLGANVAEFYAVNCPEDLSRESRPPLLFLHGVEFSGPKEVLRDFVQPFLSSLIQPSDSQDESIKTQPAHSIGNNIPVYFIAWNSALLEPRFRTSMSSMSSQQRALSFIRRISHWGFYFRDVEKRASLAARELVPFIYKLMNNRKTGPTIISHSLGAKVWADALLQISRESTMRIRPGVWWNLQPALSYRAFSAGGEYETITRLYQSCDHARSIIWYSRMDFVLSTLFLIAKRARAMGQFGCHGGNGLPQRDVTLWIKEAHGMAHIRGRLGSFFRRAAHLIPDEAKALGII
ncbi:MAG: hypothetical protein NTV34_13350 [Proteobacteria bacterium]|nr:hypothetical protein [Pseudomonadota bacterium]